MTITFEDNNDFIVYALEKIIAYVRKNKIRSNIGHIESWTGLLGDSKLSIATDLQVPDLARLGCSVHRSQVGQIQTCSGDFSASESDSDSTTETNIENEVVKNCELFLEQSK